MGVTRYFSAVKTATAFIVQMCLLIVLVATPFLAVIVFYVLLIRGVAKLEKELKCFQQMDNSNDSSNIYTRNNSTNPPSNLTTTVRRRIQSIVELRKTRLKSVKIAKSVTLLICTLSLCCTMLVVSILLVLINSFATFMEAKTLQQIVLFSTFPVVLNPCINPFIYFFKQPAFRRRTKKLFKRCLPLSNDVR